jgi:hypothetical protein
MDGGCEVDVREALAKRLGTGAAWREAQVAEDPEVEGSRRSAYALNELVGLVMTLSENDHRLEAIAGLSIGEGPFSGSGDQVDELIARYGANRHLQPHPDSFLHELVGIADRDARSSREERRTRTAGENDVAGRGNGAGA